MTVRTVTVELLRAGPRHNQLVSPTTQYLGVCGNSPAGRVTLPYEHGDLERLLQALRYRDTVDGDPLRSAKVLDRLGRDVAQLLAAVPGVAGALNDEDERPQALTHLRIVLSASELALLPFEATKLPQGDGAESTWLALKVRNPACVTRHIRSVSAAGLRWPVKPRLLFVAGPDTPADTHEQALTAALQPWRDAGDSVQSLLTVLKQPGAATVAGITHAVREAVNAGRPYTHVHLLAHGVPFDAFDRYSAIGLQLHDDAPVGGDRLATALSAMGANGMHRPTVVTLAACESGQVADVRSTHASMAHELHDQGIALVVASQFPLSIPGSVPFVERFYGGQWWGEHPLVSLLNVRQHLHSLLGGENHDWASLVAYEAFPADLAAQLDEVGYWQARRAHDLALQRLEAAADAPPADWQARAADVQAMAQRLPARGPFALECAGLRASGHKRIGLAALARAPGAPGAEQPAWLKSARAGLDEARSIYWNATRSFLASWSEPGRLKANLHWLLGQVLALDGALGRPLDAALVATARLAAETDLEGPQPSERAWAHVSLAELALLQLTDPALDAAARAQAAATCLQHAGQVLQLLGAGSEQAFTTGRQFRRYVDFWGAPALAPVLQRLGVPPREHWHFTHGVVPTAARVAALLQSPVAAPETAPETAEAGPAAAPAVAAPATALLAARTRTGPLTIEMLPAANGDCLWLEWGPAKSPRRLLVDCGAKATARLLAPRLAALKPVRGRPLFELFVLTHIDADHINGVLPLFANPAVKGVFGDIWFNGTPQMTRFLSVKQGDEFSTRLGDAQAHWPWNRAFTPDGRVPPQPVVVASEALPTVELPGGLRLTLLAPRPAQLTKMATQWAAELKPKPGLLGRKARPLPDPKTVDLKALADVRSAADPSAPNGSSIALLAEYGARSVLLTGDAHVPGVVASLRRLLQARGLKRLPLGALKLSHHGSANATSVELLSLIDCPRYLVSTDGSIFQHPDVEAMARVIVHGGPRPTLCFNHRVERTAYWDDAGLKQRYGYATHYPDKGRKGLRLTLDPNPT